MFVVDCSFDESKDIQEVDQFGFVDIVECMSNEYVPSNLNVDPSLFNGIEDPASIIGKPSDAFEAMRMQDQIMDGLKKDSSKSVNTENE